MMSLFTGHRWVPLFLNPQIVHWLLIFISRCIGQVARPLLCGQQLLLWRCIQLLTELALHTTGSTMCPPLLKSPLSSLESQILRVREYSRGAGLVLRPGGAAAARRQLALRTRQIQLIPAQTGAPGQTDMQKSQDSSARPIE